VSDSLCITTSDLSQCWKLNCVPCSFLIHIIFYLHVRFVFFLFLLLHLLLMLSTLFAPAPLRRDQKVPWSVCTLGTRCSSSSRGGRWVLMSSWRGWRGTRRPSSASANAPWATETATTLHRPAPLPRAHYQQTWDQYVTKAVSHVTLSCMMTTKREWRSTVVTSAFT